MEYFIHLAILICIYGILSMSLNLVVGYTGLLSVTHAAFYGIGAYVTSIFLTRHDVSFVVAVILSVLVTALVSGFVGVVLSKFKDDYYALGSLGLNVIIYSILLNWHEVTRGPLGVAGIPKPDIFGFVFRSSSSFLFLSVVTLILIYLVCRFIARSSFGRVLKAIREDADALSVFGYNTAVFKLVIFVISASLASLAGVLFATYITFIDPTTFTVMESIFVLAIIILGGLANLEGSILGALIMVLLPEALRFVGFPNDIAAQMRQVVYGIILIVLMLYRPQGILGEYKL